MHFRHLVHEYIRPFGLVKNVNILKKKKEKKTVTELKCSKLFSSYSILLKRNTDMNELDLAQKALKSKYIWEISIRFFGGIYFILKTIWNVSFCLKFPFFLFK